MWIVRTFVRLGATIAAMILIGASFFALGSNDSTSAIVLFVLAVILIAWSERNKRKERYRELREAMY